jgi:hypothetical protein
MIHESQPLIDLIIKELRIVQGEITLAKTTFEMKELPPPKSIVELAMQVHEQSNEVAKFLKVMDYNEGKFDAYIKILRHLGVEYKRDE